MIPVKLTVAAVPGIRNLIMATQKHTCILCNVSFIDKKVKNGKVVPAFVPTLDHDHGHGHVRAVLCNNCNGLEGKIMKLAGRCKRDRTDLEWLKDLVAYLDKHQTPQTPYIHPAHKTEDEKRLMRNKKARLRSAQQKAARLVGN